MPDYSYYRDVFMGTALDQPSFSRLIRRAESWLLQLEGCCRVVSYGDESRKLALCAAAETLYFHGGKRGVSRSSLGGVSLEYEQGGVPLQRLLLEAVSGYLEVYRGVG